MSPLMDFLFDMRLSINASFRELARKIDEQPSRNILITGVEAPDRNQDLKNVMRALSSRKHNITIKPAPMREGRGKFQNINDCLQNIDIFRYDWMIVADDDIAVPDRFVDRFICLAESTNLMMCQPAHRFLSFKSFELTERRWNSLIHFTHFVECGPLTAFRSETFPFVLPFPDLRWAWGTDILWGEIARKEHFRMGVVDATPIRHLRAVASSYGQRPAAEEAKSFLMQAGINRARREILSTIEVVTTLDSAI